MPDAGAVAGPDTIYAVSTGPGTAAVAVIRVSGPSAWETLATLAGDVPSVRRAVVRELKHDGEILDQALVIAFAENASFTGERMVEFQCHGGRAVVSGIMDALDALGGRVAEPGEFTRRAVLAGRMDLLVAEGLGDLVAAETAVQRRQALRAMASPMTQRLDTWRTSLIEARALLEVTIDWADEEVPEDASPEVSRLIDDVMAGMTAELKGAAAAERLRQGYEVAIIGAPNVGKSSLLNAIAGREAAIVSDIPGTTRDVIEVRYDLDGLPVTFLDTAGLRDTDDAIEAEGVRRAMARAEGADLRVLLRSADTDADPKVFPENCEMTVWTKADVLPVPGVTSIAARTGQGLDALLSAISSRLAENAAWAGMLGHRRQSDAVRAALDHLSHCRQLLDQGDIEARAEDLRLAVAALDRLTGRLAVEDMLDVVFGRFCLGK
ncbi:MAG: tRNA uridine-5-carboxymethylaminomethyl(34) synthesis GTPase MnmE [Pseudomonadota bacterium]